MSSYLCAYRSLVAGGTQANNTTRATNLSGDARAPAAGGLAGLSPPDLERMLGGSQDQSMIQLMQSPAISQLMQSFLSNPQYMNEVVNFFFR